MRIGFFSSSHDTSIGSYRIWVKDLNQYFNDCGIDSTICTSHEDIVACDILICAKNDAHTAKLFKNRFANKKVGIINLAADQQIEVDFVIVGSLEEKDSLSFYENVFLFPLVESMMQDISIKKHKKSDILTLGFHGSHTHLAKFRPNLASALEELDKELNIKLKVITSNKHFDWKVGRPKIKNIEIKQWNIDTICDELRACDIGLVPNLTTIFEQSSTISADMGLYSTDYTVRFKNKSNAGRSFVFHQLGIPVVSDLTPSNFHILGNPECGFVAHSKLGWKKSILSLSDHLVRGRVADNAKKEFDRLYDPHMWAARLYKEIMEIS